MIGWIYQFGNVIRFLDDEISVNLKQAIGVGKESDVKPISRESRAEKDSRRHN